MLHAAERFAVNRHLADAPALSREFKTFVKIEDQRLKIALRCGASGMQTAAARSSVLDLVVERAYQAAMLLGDIDNSGDKAQHLCAVVALGGYGRGELAPYSDLDILFLYPNHRALQTRRLVEQILRLLWDAGLTVGPSFRTITDCVAAAHADPHLQTALVSTRLLAGNGSIYDSLLQVLEKDRRKRAEAYVSAILRERAARYAKFGSAVCLQEPNVKESPAAFVTCTPPCGWAMPGMDAGPWMNSATTKSFPNLNEKRHSEQSTFSGACVTQLICRPAGRRNGLPSISKLSWLVRLAISRGPICSLPKNSCVTTISRPAI